MGGGLQLEQAEGREGNTLLSSIVSRLFGQAIGEGNNSQGAYILLWNQELQSETREGGFCL